MHQKHPPPSVAVSRRSFSIPPPPIKGSHRAFWPAGRSTATAANERGGRRVPSPSSSPLRPAGLHPVVPAAVDVHVHVAVRDLAVHLRALAAQVRLHRLRLRHLA